MVLLKRIPTVIDCIADLPGQGLGVVKSGFDSIALICMGRKCLLEFIGVHFGSRLCNESLWGN